MWRHVAVWACVSLCCMCKGICMMHVCKCTWLHMQTCVCIRPLLYVCVSLCVSELCKLLTSGLNLSMFPAAGWAGKWQALSKISAVFTGMMGISGTFPTAVKSSAFPAPLNTPGSFLRPARVPIKQLRRLVFGNSCPLKGVINSWKTVFTVKSC